MCIQDTVLLTTIADSSGRRFEWIRENVTIGKTSVLPVREFGAYRVRVTTEKGCSVLSDQYVVSQKTDCPDTRLYIPTAFTPNGDGINGCLGSKNDY